MSALTVTRPASATRRVLNGDAAPVNDRAQGGLVVIGAGPAGLATAIGFGGACTVVERRRDVGGLSASIEIDGAVFDVGGHSFWTPHPEVRRLVYESVEMVEQRRHACCWFRGAWIDYPFQRHYEKLPDERVREECRQGLAAADGGAGAAHFGEYLVRKFGAGVAGHFLLPYNRKLWARDLGRLATDWTAERVAAPSREAETLLGVVEQRSPCRRTPSSRTRQRADSERSSALSPGAFPACASAPRRSASISERANSSSRTGRCCPGSGWSPRSRCQSCSPGFPTFRRGCTSARQVSNTYRCRRCSSWSTGPSTGICNAPTSPIRPSSRTRSR